MTNGEIQTIRNVIARLKKPNAGCSVEPGVKNENVSRLYIDTWLIGPLESLLPEQRNVKLAEKLSRQ